MLLFLSVPPGAHPELAAGVGHLQWLETSSLGQQSLPRPGRTRQRGAIYRALAPPPTAQGKALAYIVWGFPKGKGSTRSGTQRGHFLTARVSFPFFSSLLYFPLFARVSFAVPIALPFYFAALSALPSSLLSLVHLFRN